MNAVTETICSKCGATNPAAAKFCSACRNPLQATATPTPAPPVNPVPPPRPSPGIGGMMSGGGKTVTKQVNGDAHAVYAQTVKHLRGLADTEIQHELAPQQLAAKVGFKSFGLTLGMGIEVDTSVQIAPTTPGQSQVAITTKTDSSSTSKLLITSIVIWLMIWFSWGLAPMILLLGAIAMGLSWWQLQTSPGESIAKALVAELTNIRSTAPEPQETAAPTPAPATPDPAPQPVAAELPPKPGSAAPAAAAAEDEVFERIGKLAKLKDAGAITDAEFEAKKAELLERI
ncbi:MAG: SHOCT domain-containing protein [Pseudomonadota bacterium]